MTPPDTPFAALPAAAPSATPLRATERAVPTVRWRWRRLLFWMVLLSLALHLGFLASLLLVHRRVHEAAESPSFQVLFQPPKAPIGKSGAAKPTELPAPAAPPAPASQPSPPAVAPEPVPPTPQPPTPQPPTPQPPPLEPPVPQAAPPPVAAPPQVAVPPQVTAAQPPPPSAPPQPTVVAPPPAPPQAIPPPSAAPPLSSVPAPSAEFVPASPAPPLSAPPPPSSQALPPAVPAPVLPPPKPPAPPKPAPQEPPQVRLSLPPIEIAPPDMFLPTPPTPAPPRRGPRRPPAFPAPMDTALGTGRAPSTSSQRERGTGGVDFRLGKAILDSNGEPPRDTQSRRGDIVVRGAHVGKDWEQMLAEWWREHGYYPQEAARRGEDGTVTLHVIADRYGHVKLVDVENSSGSQWLDMGAVATFRGANLPPFPPGTPEKQADMDITIHYILIRH